MHSPRRAAMHRSPDFIQRLHLSLSLLQPVRHAHLAVHRRGSGEVLAGLLTLSRAPVEFAEAEVAVGDERSHAELGGERHSLLEMRSSRVGVSGIAAFLGLAEGAETLRLVAPLAASAGVLKPALGDGPRLTWLASQQQRLAVQAEVAGSPIPVTGLRLHRCVSQQCEAVRETPNACVRVTEQSRA